MKEQQEENDSKSNNIDKSTITPIQTKLYIFSACAALNSCNLGYDLGVNTGTAKLIQNSMDLSDVQIEIFMGFLDAFAMIGALGAQYISDDLGRRKSFQVSGIIFNVGILIMITSWNYPILLFGRIFVGLGVGFGLAIDPIYISEISPAEHRGYLVTWSEIGTNIGILLGFASGLVFSGVSDDPAWRYMFALGTILPTILLFLSYYVMPESPRWLVSKGRDDEAILVLQQIYPDGYPVETIVDDIRETLQKELNGQNAIDWKSLLLHPSPAFRRMLMVGLGIAVAQQLVGVEAILYYMVYILEDAGLEDRNSQYLFLIYIGLLKMAYIVASGRFFDKWGRRIFIFISLAGLALTCFIQSLNFMIQDTNIYVTVYSLASYFIFFSIGMGPGAWLIASEVFATSIRAKAMSLATFLNRLVATISVLTLLSLAKAITWGGVFLLLVSICCLLGIFFYYYLPETKGRSLEDMTLYFAEITGDTSMLQIEEALSSGSLSTSSLLHHSDSRTVDTTEKIELF